MKLRPIRTQPTVQDGEQGVLLSDPLALSRKVLFVPNAYALLLALLDGTRDVGTLKTGFELRTGTPLSSLLLDSVVAQLDEALFLENDRFAQAYSIALQEYRAATSRAPALAGTSYPARPEELDRSLQAYVQNAVAGTEPADQIQGLISPHIDFNRGGHIYAAAWWMARESLRQAELVVILGTDHNDAEGRVTLTRQSYATPWGVVPTEVEVVNQFVEELGEETFRCELHHRTEHSIEMAVVWLHYFLRDPPCPVVPVLCGSFDSFIEQGRNPSEAEHIASTVTLLRRLARSRQAIIVAAADLSHVGPAFGDPVPLDAIARARLANEDQELLSIVAQGRADDFYEQVRREENRRRICGLPPGFIALSALEGVTGTLVGYDQCPAAEHSTSLVSICGMTLKA